MQLYWCKYYRKGLVTNYINVDVLQDGTGHLPQTKVMEKQSAIIDELRDKLDIKLDDFDKLSTDELRQTVDSAIGRVSMDVTARAYIQFV